MVRGTGFELIAFACVYAGQGSCVTLCVTESFQSTSKSGTVWPLNSWVQSSRNCTVPSVTQE